MERKTSWEKNVVRRMGVAAETSGSILMVDRTTKETHQSNLNVYSIDSILDGRRSRDKERRQGRRDRLNHVISSSSCVPTWIHSTSRHVFTKPTATNGNGSIT
jgi:hypothetical protein